MNGANDPIALSAGTPPQAFRAWVPGLHGALEVGEHDRERRLCDQSLISLRSRSELPRRLVRFTCQPQGGYALTLGTPHVRP
jgi:hypothetical protein